MSESAAIPPSPDGLPAAIEAALAGDDTPRRAIEIARLLGVDRSDVNRVLYANPDRFTRHEGAMWSVVGSKVTPTAGIDQSPGQTHPVAGSVSPRVESPVAASSAVDQEVEPLPPAATLHRPGPFGPARDLLPKDPHIEMVSLDASVESAIDLMSERNYSQLLVRGGDARAIGVFSWRQFSLRCLGLKRLNRKFSEVVQSPVRDFMRDLRPSDFIAPDQYVDTDVDWIKSDFVIVGSPEVPLGILTISDVWGILNDFAEAFVLLHEIELTLRSIVTVVAGGLIDEWIASAWVPEGHATPTRLDGLTLHHFTALICKKEDRWPRFAPCIGGPRELFEAELLNVVDIRNQVMHFKSKASPTMCGHLKEFRDRLRMVLQRASR